MSLSKCPPGLVVFEERYFPYIGKSNHLKRSWSEPDLHAVSEPFDLGRADSCSVGSVDSSESFKAFTTPPESSVILSEFGEGGNSSSSGDGPPPLQSSSDDELVNPAAEAAEDSEDSSEVDFHWVQQRLRNHAWARLRQTDIHRFHVLRQFHRHIPIDVFFYLLNANEYALRGHHQ